LRAVFGSARLAGMCSVRVSLLALCAIVLVGCGSVSVNNSTGQCQGTNATGTVLQGSSTSYKFEQKCDACPAGTLDAAPGAEICGGAEHCTAVCCPCAGSTKKFAAQVCKEGVCLGAAQACDWVVSQRGELCL
jgi:hypothetical protein